MMVLLFYVQIGGSFVQFVDEIDLARIGLSCHFALGLLCDTEGTHHYRSPLPAIRVHCGTELLPPL